MLIGKSPKRPNLETVRRIKRVLLEVLPLPEEAIVTVSQLACREQDCAPIETVIGLLRPGAPQLQYTVHKAVAEIVVADLQDVCAAWDFAVQHSAIESSFISNHT